MRRSLLLLVLMSGLRTLAGASFRRAPARVRPLNSPRRFASVQMAGGGTSEPAPKFSVAPMMDYTDRHFRYLWRLMSTESVLYTEMVAANKVVHAPDDKLLDRFLGFSPVEEPLVLQLGGADPRAMVEAAKVSQGFGYREVNLNCGCPSERVAGKGAFGASLMRDADLVADLMLSLRDGMPDSDATVKCRIGVDEMDSFEDLLAFVETVAEKGKVSHFVVHARKALLGKKFSPEDNRKVPPLRRDRVHRLMAALPHLDFTLNGGITTYEEVNDALEQGYAGVMVGRACIQRPYYWSRVDEVVYGTPRTEDRCRRTILEKYCAYAEERLAGEELRTRRFLSKPLQNLFSGEPSGKKFRAKLDSTIISTPTFTDAVMGAAAELSDLTLSLQPEEIDLRNAADFDGSLKRALLKESSAS